MGGLLRGFRTAMGWRVRRRTVAMVTSLTVACGLVLSAGAAPGAAAQGASCGNAFNTDQFNSNNPPPVSPASNLAGQGVQPGPALWGAGGVIVGGGLGGWAGAAFGSATFAGGVASGAYVGAGAGAAVTATAAWLLPLAGAVGGALIGAALLGLLAYLLAQLFVPPPAQACQPCISCNLQAPPDRRPPIYAPDLYLYPVRAETVHVDLQGTVTASRPLYGPGGWTVEASPDGGLGAAGGHLFYDAAASERWQTAQGWVVPEAAWPAWIRTELPALGLNATETGDFLRDWAGDLPPAPDYLIAPQPRSLVDAAVGLRITPRPDTLYRLWLYIVPLRAPVAAAPPQVAPLVRRGFTAVEWGVVFPPGVTPPCTPEVDCAA